MWLHGSQSDNFLKSMDFARLQGFLTKLVSIHSKLPNVVIDWSSDIAKMGAAGCADMRTGVISLSVGFYEKFDDADLVYDVYSGLALHEVAHLQH